MGSMQSDIPVRRRRPWPRRPVVGDLRLLVHLPADAVTDVLLDDPEPVALPDIGDCSPDVTEMTALAHLVDPGPQGLLGHIDETSHLGRSLRRSPR